MSQIRVVAPPTSRAKLRSAAAQIRSLTDKENEPHFPIVYLVEHYIDRIVNGYSFHIGSMSEMGDDHGLTVIADREIIIREDVYAGACAGKGRDRFTVAHELAHAILHSDVSLARHDPAITLKNYNCPEWQADCFAGELLTPLSLIKNYTNAHKVSVDFGVSVAAARVALRLKK